MFPNRDIHEEMKSYLFTNCLRYRNEHIYHNGDIFSLYDKQKQCQAEETCAAFH